MDPLLPPALRFLIRLHARGFVRRMFRKARGVKGITMTLVGGILFLLWISTVFLGNLSDFRHHRPGHTFQPVFDPGTVQTLLPVGLLAVSLLTLIGATSGKGIAFTAAESDFLFPGPYSRRQILLYRLCRNWVPVLWGGFFFGTGAHRFSASWPAAYLAAALTLLYIQVFATAAALLFARVEQKISAARFRNLIFSAIALLAIAALYLVPAPPLDPAAAAGGFNALVLKLARSPLLQRAAFPFRPFAHAFTAPTFPSLLAWSAVCLAVIAATVALTFRLDADFYESASALAARNYETLAQRRRGQLPTQPGSSRLRLPPLPHLAGAGAIFWRQATTALRSLKTVLFILLLACSGGVPLLIAKGIHDRSAIAAFVAMMLAMITLLGGALFRFDFRADVDRIDTLKALPISPLALTLGQLATPILFMAAFQTLLLLICILLLPAEVLLILSAGLFIPLFSTVFISIENLAFLLFPTRGQTTPGDLTAAARGALLLLAKLATLASIAALSFAIAFVIHLFTHSYPLALTAAWLTAATLAAALIPLTAYTYQSFDPSAEQTPGS